MCVRHASIMCGISLFLSWKPNENSFFLIFNLHNEFISICFVRIFTFSTFVLSQFYSVAACLSSISFCPCFPFSGSSSQMQAKKKTPRRKSQSWCDTPFDFWSMGIYFAYREMKMLTRCHVCSIKSWNNYTWAIDDTGLDKRDDAHRHVFVIRCH